MRRKPAENSIWRILVVEGSHPAEITAAIDQIATAVSLHSESFEAVLSRTDLTGLRRKGLHYLPSTQLSQINQFLNQIDRWRVGKAAKHDMRHIFHLRRYCGI